MLIQGKGDYNEEQIFKLEYSIYLTHEEVMRMQYQQQSYIDDIGEDLVEYIATGISDILGEYYAKEFRLSQEIGRPIANVDEYHGFISSMSKKPDDENL